MTKNKSKNVVTIAKYKNNVYNLSVLRKNLSMEVHQFIEKKVTDLKKIEDNFDIIYYK